MLDLRGYLIWLAVALPACFESSKLLPIFTSFLQKRGLDGLARMAIVLMTAAAAVLLYFRTLPQIPDLLVRSSAQLGLCVLFGLMSAANPSPPRPRPEFSTSLGRSRETDTASSTRGIQ